ncbi:D-alanyl-D-alanine carboxypeptidase family protein [Rhizobium alarense]|uniref:D-alanyl-D-alanine carboxypeptidase family protein n=1 Tax=Rhizobium alarense TaxID=2846851 RepID=UPI0038B56B32
MVRCLFRLFLVVLLLPQIAAAQEEAGFETKARQIYLVEAETGTVLYARGEDEPVPAASLAKLMTVAVVFRAISAGEISLDTTYTVSEHAWRTGGAPSGTATMFAALKSSIRIDDLLRGVMIQNANDGCIILAEGLAGSEAAFAGRMNAEARRIGLTVSTFANATGLPDPGNRVTMRELVHLARYLHDTFPALYARYSEPEFEWNRILQRNKNPLVAMKIGVDGLGMGYADGYGFGLVSSVNRDGRRLYLAMGGLETDKARIEEARRVIDWAMTAFERRTLFAAGETIAEASVYGGDVSHVPLMTPEKVDVFLPVDNGERLSARVVYTWPIRAPVKPGLPMGTLRIWNGERLLREVPLETAAAVDVGTLKGRALDALQELFFFWL